MILITGAAGFIGSAIAARLNELNRNDLILVDHLGSSDKWKNLRSLRYLDYMERDDLLKALQSGILSRNGLEAVFHLGACSATTERDATFLVHNNFEYTKTLGQFCASDHIRFIYASSAATYGEGKEGYSDQRDNLEQLRPLNMYGYSKHMFDLWARQRGLHNHFVGIKYFNVFGPNEYHKADMRSMVVKAYEQIKQMGRVQLFKSHIKEYKDGEQMRDFVYIKDAVAMTLHFLDANLPGGLYNVGTGKARTWLDMMKALFKALNLSPQIDFIDMPEALRGKYQYFTEAEISKIRNVGYTSQALSVEESVNDYVTYLEKGYAHLGD